MTHDQEWHKIPTQLPDESPRLADFHIEEPVRVNGDQSGEQDADVGDLLSISQTDHGGQVLALQPVGQLDASTSPLLQSRITDALGTAHGLIVDLTGVTLLSSAGVAVLVGAKDDAAARSVWLVLVLGSRVARRALEASGLLALFDVAEDSVEALDSSR